MARANGVSKDTTVSEICVRRFCNAQADWAQTGADWQCAGFIKVHRCIVVGGRFSKLENTQLEEADCAMRLQAATSHDAATKADLQRYIFAG
jgi:hypothetical protein